MQWVEQDIETLLVLKKRQLNAQKQVMSLSMVILTRIKILRDLNAYDSQSMQVLTDETEGNISLQGKTRLFFYNQPLQTHFLWSTIADDRTASVIQDCNFHLPAR